MVTYWLLNSLSKEIGVSVIYSTSAKILWNSLEHIFGQTNGVKLYQLQKEISMLVQGVQGRAPQRNNNQSQQKSWINSQKVNNTQQKPKGRKAKFNPNVSCTHCMKIGHVRADCYRINGFPDDFQFTRSTQVKANAIIEGQDNDNGSTQSNDATPQTQFFSKEQVSELMNLIKQAQFGTTATP
uniref:Uncharacterized protein n=1 Tax=Nicotiana tabacum TaxID=4097 RepID=A0A1S3YE53_TOBAC|nr:PREDICTED: uncharacterized protein LOC107775312 [Nicotiana tabacum]XP_016450522.1 PREDICTED: uncharacterized protein LOC107775312 [Nicotiana tabacum]